MLTFYPFSFGLLSFFISFHPFDPGHLLQPLSAGQQGLYSLTKAFLPALLFLCIHQAASLTLYIGGSQTATKENIPKHGKLGGSVGAIQVEGSLLNKTIVDSNRFVLP